MIKKKHIVSIFFIILLLAIPPAFQFEPVFAENKLRQIIKIADNFPSGQSTYDIPIDPPLENLDRAFLFYSVSHVTENEASDLFKIVKILDKNTVRIIAEDTASGVNPIDIIIIIIEYDSNSEINVQHIQESLSAVSGSQDFLMGSVNTTSSFLINRGVALNGSFTAIGNNDFNRLRILNSTAWEVNIDTAPDTPQGQAIDIVDMNMSDVSVQRGLHTLTGTSSTLVGGTDFTAIDPTRTMLLVTYTVDGASSGATNRITLQAVLSSGGDITFSRRNSSDNVFIAWELIEFPSTFVKITHFDTDFGEDSSKDVTVSQIKDFDKVFAMSHVGSPFGNAMGKANSGSAGRLDLAQAIFSVRSNTVVTVQRDDSSEDVDFGWQLVEFFETDVAENAQGNNTLRQIVKIEDEYLGSSSVNQYFPISPPLLDISKAMVFMTTSNTYSGTTTDVSERIKRYEILNTTTLRITGSNDPFLTNEAMPFHATIVEFDSTSPILVQRDQVQYSADSSNDARYFEGEFLMHSSPLNATGSNIFFQGWSGNVGGSAGTGDFTFGAEEVPLVRIIDGTQWGYEIDNPTDFQEVVSVVNLIDYNQNNISVQRGISLLDLTLSVSPPVDVIQNQTLLFATIRSTNNEFDNEIDDLGVLATLDNSSPPNIIFERVSNTDTDIEISWELISFPLRTLFVQHGIHSQSAGTSNSTSAIPRPVDNVTTAFVTGTVNMQNGYSGGKGSLTAGDTFGEITGKMSLDDTTTARFERGLSVGSWDVGFQVVEFQGAFSIVAMETVGGEIETNSTTGDSIPACCNDGVINNPVASYTELEIDIIHQLLEWFEPNNSPLEGMINDIENNGKALFEIILRMNNGTYGVDANLTSSAEFYQNQYLNRVNLTEFIININEDVRTNFGATTP